MEFAVTIVILIHRLVYTTSCPLPFLAPSEFLEADQIKIEMQSDRCFEHTFIKRAAEKAVGSGTGRMAMIEANDKTGLTTVSLWVDATDLVYRGRVVVDSLAEGDPAPAYDKNGSPPSYGGDS